MKKTIILFFAMLGLSVHAQMQIDLKSGALTKSEESTAPTREVREVEGGYEVTYTFSAATIQEDKLFPGTVFWKVDGFGLNNIPGQAEYLFRNDRFAVPKDSKCTVEVVDCDYVDYSYELTPARQTLLANDKTGYTRETVKAIEPFEGFQPASVASVVKMQTYRGRGICSAMICPIQYNHREKTVRAYTSITYRLTIETAEAVGELPFMSVDDNLLRNTTLNHGGDLVMTLLKI